MLETLINDGVMCDARSKARRELSECAAGMSEKDVKVGITIEYSSKDQSGCRLEEQSTSLFRMSIADLYLQW